jgi:hypothetical protein
MGAFMAAAEGDEGGGEAGDEYSASADDCADRGGSPAAELSSRSPSSSPDPYVEIPIIIGCRQFASEIDVAGRAAFGTQRPPGVLFG